MLPTAIAKAPPYPKSPTRSPVLTTAEGMDMKKQNKTKIGVGREDHKGGKYQEDKEKGDAMCPVCGGEEEVTSTIRRWYEK